MKGKHARPIHFEYLPTVRATLAAAAMPVAAWQAVSVQPRRCVAAPGPDLGQGGATALRHPQPAH